MKMKIIGKEKRLCTCCMEEHEIKTVIIHDKSTFKNKSVEYDAKYFFCDMADELYMDEHFIRENDINIKNAYRKAEGLLTSDEIIAIRNKYGITQTDLCTLLGWGGKTITRYESYQVQDKAHDSILKKIDSDPEWFLSLLNASKAALSEDAYQKYYNKAANIYESEQDLYLRRAIEATYAGFEENDMYHGKSKLDLDKVVDVIRYFSASRKVINLYKVKLMKMLWYADAVAFNQRGHSITGLVYRALPMGAVPVGHNNIIELKNVPCEEEGIGEAIAYHFYLKEEENFPALSEEDKAILDVVISKFGDMSTDQIISFMHKEKAYAETAPKDVIAFEYSDSLQI